MILARSAREGFGEARSGSMEADGDGVRRDPEHCRDVLVAQLLPGDEAQELLVGGRKRGQGDEGGAVAGLAGVYRRRDVLHAKEGGQSLASTVATSMIGQHSPRHGVQPGERLRGGDGVELAPGDREGLGSDVLGIGKVLCSPYRIGEDGALVLREDGVEARETGGRCGVGHRARTTGGGARFPGSLCDDASVEIAPIAGIVFAAVAGGVVAFQLALAMGAPWATYAMGGAFPGRFPPPMRVAAVVQAVLIGFLAVVVLSAAGLVLPDLAAVLPWLVWIPVAVSAVALVLNAISRSAGERRIWVPVTAAMLVSSLVVALD